MKRLRHVYEKMCDLTVLEAAFGRVQRGHRGKRDMQRFSANLLENLAGIRRELEAGVFRFGDYRYFTVYEPKERRIAAATVRERVVHHAIIAVCGERLERALIDRSYACRKGLGQWKAVAEAQRLMRRHAWCLKLDMRRFFDSIDHAVMLRLLARKIGDRRMLGLFEGLLASYETTPGKGLPIGNLTSQYFANFYLSGFDRALKEQRHVKKYVRYMDDMLIFSPDKKELQSLYQYAVLYLKNNLHLTLKPAVIGSVTKGAPFLGFLIKPAGIYLQKKTKIRYKKRVAEFTHKLNRGCFSELEAGSRIESATAHLLLARSRTFRNNILCGRVLWV